MSYSIPSIRLASYERFFGITQNPIALNGAYSWCRFISSQLFLMIGDFEVMLRSHLHISLSRHCFPHKTADSEYWFIDEHLLNSLLSQYQQLPAFPTNTQITALKRTQFSSPFRLGDSCNSMIMNAILDLFKKNRNRCPSPDDIISNLSFGFWVSFMKDLKHKANTAILPSLLANIFPNFQGTHDRALLDAQTDTLFRLKNIRNRISHQDSILRTPESKYPQPEFIPRNQQHLIISLRRLVDLLVKFLADVSQDFASDVKNTQYWMLLDTLLERNFLEIFKISGGDPSTHLLPVLLSQFNRKHNSAIFINI